MSGTGRSWWCSGVTCFACVIPFRFLRYSSLASDPTDSFPLTIPSLPDPCADAQHLAVKAERCRRLAAGISDRQTTDVLLKMAATYEEAAERLKVTESQD